MIPTIMNARQIYYKQKNEDFFPPVAYIVADILAFAPITVIDVFTYGTIVYWMTGMASDVAAYFNWIGILDRIWTLRGHEHTSPMLLPPKSQCRIGHERAPHGAFHSHKWRTRQPVSLITQSWLVWLYWANPFAYTLRGLLIDQLTCWRLC